VFDVMRNVVMVTEWNGQSYPIMIKMPIKIPIIVMIIAIA